jgi:hypothetical protein
LTSTGYPASQTELFSLLNSPHSKIVGTSLNMLRQIANEEKFEHNHFLEYLPLLTANGTKTIVTGSIAISELIWKKDKSLSIEIAPLLCGVFVNRDETIQLRAAKLLLKLARSTTLEIADVLETYSQTMLANTKTALQPLFNKQTEEDVGDKQQFQFLNKHPEPRNSLVPLPKIETFEDFVFLFRQALDNNESWHLDHIAAGLIEFQDNLDDGKIKQLLPAFQRAWNYVANVWTSSTGYLDYMLAYFIIDVGMVIIKRYPSEGALLRTLYDNSLEKHNIWLQQWREHGTNLSFFTTLTFDSEEEFYDSYKRLLDLVLLRLKRRINLPLLSTPTHSPGWLDPGVLTQRLHFYKRERVEPENMDFQLAISRCKLEMVSPEIYSRLESLSLPHKNLLSFLFNRQLKAEEAMRYDSLWVIAAITKDTDNIGAFVNGGLYGSLYEPMLTGQYSWKAYVEDYRAQKQEVQLYSNWVRQNYCCYLLYNKRLFVVEMVIGNTYLSIIWSLIFWHKFHNFFV